MTDAILRTERCVLRPWRTEDAALLVPIANTREISWNTSYRFAYPFDQQAAEKYVATNIACRPPEGWSYVITIESHIVGGCKVWRGEGVHAHTAEIGYWLGVAHWGKGLATEVVATVINHVRADSDLDLLTANSFGWNPASARILKKCGFRKVGIIPNGVKKWGKTTDLHIWDLPLR